MSPPQPPVIKHTGNEFFITEYTEADAAANIDTHTRLMALFRDYPGEPLPERQNQSGFY